MSDGFGMLAAALGGAGGEVVDIAKEYKQSEADKLKEQRIEEINIRREQRGEDREIRSENRGLLNEVEKQRRLNQVGLEAKQATLDMNTNPANVAKVARAEVAGQKAKDAYADKRFSTELDHKKQEYDATHPYSEETQMLENEKTMAEIERMYASANNPEDKRYFEHLRDSYKLLVDDHKNALERLDKAANDQERMAANDQINAIEKQLSALRGNLFQPNGAASPVEPTTDDQGIAELRKTLTGGDAKPEPKLSRDELFKRLQEMNPNLEIPADATYLQLKKEYEKEMAAKQQPTDTKNYGKRPDGTNKGTGFLGELKMKDGSGNVATEMTIGVNLDGKETNIPAIVPTLSQEQLEYLLKGGEISKRPDIIRTAVAHAKDRIAKGLSPYQDATEDKQGKASSKPAGMLSAVKRSPYLSTRDGTL